MSETFQEFCKRILPVVQAGADGKNIDFFSNTENDWVGDKGYGFWLNTKYRVAEPKATPLPITPEMWAMINHFYVCAVMTDCGDVLFCSQVTEWSDDDRKFGCEYGFGDNCKSPLSIDTTGIIPELSLTKRPDNYVVENDVDVGSIAVHDVVVNNKDDVYGNNGLSNKQFVRRSMSDIDGVTVDATHYAKSIAGNHVDLYKRDPLNNDRWLTWGYQNSGWIKVQLFGIEPQQIK